MLIEPGPVKGMNVAAGPELCAAVTNAGGLGVIGMFVCPMCFRYRLTGFG